VRRGAEAALDHHLLTARLKLKLKRIDRQTEGRTKYNVNLLKDYTTQSAFNLNLKNRFQELQELTTEDTNAHDLWKRTKDAITETCQEVLGPKKKQHKDWNSADTLLKIQNQKTQERSSQLEPHKSQQSGNTSRVHTGLQESEEEFEEGQERLYREPGRRSRKSSLSGQYERTVYDNQEACRKILQTRTASQRQAGTDTK
jgi:hypothetical protein